MSDPHRPSARSPAAAPAAVALPAAVAAGAAMAWCWAYLASVPVAWVPPRVVAGVALASSAVVGAAIARSGLGLAHAAVGGGLAGALVSLQIRLGAPPPALGSPWGPALAQATWVPALLAVLGALAGRTAGGGGGSPETWARRSRIAALSACAVALAWRGPRLTVAGATGGGGHGRPGGEWGAYDVLGHAGAGVLWPGPVAVAWCAALALVVVRRRVAGRAGFAVLAGGAWLGAETLLATPWREAAGALCGGVQLAALAADAPGLRGLERWRSPVASLAGGVIALLLVVQLTLGHAQRARPDWLWIHVLVGVALVLPAALHFGVRGWLVAETSGARRASALVAGGVTGQLALGVAAILTPPSSPRLDVGLAHLHLWCALVLLAVVAWLFLPSRGFAGPGLRAPRLRPRARAPAAPAPRPGRPP